MTAPTFFAPLWLSADMVLIETIARECASGRRDTPLARHERPSILGHALPKNPRDLPALALHFGKPRTSLAAGCEEGLAMRKCNRFAVWVLILKIQLGNLHREVLLHV